MSNNERPSISPLDLEKYLAKIRSLPGTPDYVVPGERVELARSLIDDLLPLADLDMELWEKAYEVLLDRSEIKSNHIQLAIAFLEIDPWFFRSGYLKADLIAKVRREHSVSDRPRLQTIVLRAIEYRDRREFSWYCRLGRALRTPDFQKEVEKRLLHNDKDIRRRAKWVLSAITHSPGFHLRRGKRQYDLAKYSDAIGDFNRAIFLQPLARSAYFNRGKAFARMNSFQEALDDFEKSLTLLPSAKSEWFRSKECRLDEMEVYFWRGWTFSQLGRHTQAIEDFSRVIKADSMDTYSLRERGKAYYQVQAYQSAIDDLTRCIKLEGVDGEAYYFRGLVFEAVGDKKSANADIERASELNFKIAE